MLRDRLIAGITDLNIKREIFQKGDDLKLKSLIELVHFHEAAQTQLEKMTTQTAKKNVLVNAVRRQTSNSST